jgi:hypothetical protein
MKEHAGRDRGRVVARPPHAREPASRRRCLSNLPPPRRPGPLTPGLRQVGIAAETANKRGMGLAGGMPFVMACLKALAGPPGPAA